MRFITEFKVDELRTYSLDEEAINNNIKSHKSYSLLKLGGLIEESFGWQNPVYNNKLHHRLEIEAFPMDKWEQFKRRFFMHLGTTGLYDPFFKDLIAELESFSKPSGDTI